MIDKILSVAKALFSFRGEFQKAKREKRDRIADLFEKISNCVKDVYSELKSDEVPHGKCAEMLTYANQLQSMTAGRGTYTMEFCHYDPLPKQLTQKLLEEKDAKEEEK